ncbi:MAG TPA: hypothetical protein VFV81_04385 [Verrucomicrobiae bacterium]|nr:hypothetical protein [Verrucomicrobiae bacterium]
MKTKILVWIGVSVLVAGAIGAAVWWSLRPQVVTFSDDAKLTLLAVEYGKKHAPPAVKAAGRARGRGSFTTTNDTLVLWVREEWSSKEWRNFQFYAYDKANTACVQTYPRNYGPGKQGNQVVGVAFDAFPRRQSKFIVRVQENGNMGQEISDQQFVVHNPARNPIIDWAPESLPDEQDDGDLAVTLKKFVVGARMPYSRNNDDEDDPMNLGVQATFHVQRNGTNASNWQPVAIDTFDAAGNHVSGWPNTQIQDGDLLTTYQYALWPDEPAWKLHVEFSKQSGFTDSELWTVHGIPVQAGKQRDFWNNRSQPAAVAETDLGGVHLKIFPAQEFTDVQPNSQPQGGLIIQATPALPDGVRMTIVSLTDDQTNDISYWNSGWGGDKTTSYRYGLRDFSGVTNLNLTVAVHRSRFMDFKVKPEKAALTAAAAQ